MSVMITTSPNDPIPGTAAHDYLRRELDSVTGKIAQARLLESQLPSRIHDLENRARDLRRRLGTTTGTNGGVRPPERLIAHLPASTRELVAITGEGQGVISAGLNNLRRRGLVIKDAKWGGTWRVNHHGPLGSGDAWQTDVPSSEAVSA